MFHRHPSDGKSFENNYKHKRPHLSVAIFSYEYVQNVIDLDTPCRYTTSRNVDLIRNVKANGMCLPNVFHVNRSKGPNIIREEKAISRNENEIYNDRKTEEEKEIVKSEKSLLLTRERCKMSSRSADENVTLFISYVDRKSSSSISDSKLLICFVALWKKNIIRCVN